MSERDIRIVNDVEFCVKEGSRTRVAELVRKWGVDILFLFFYFRVARRVGSAGTNVTSFVGNQISNYFFS